MKYIRVNNYIVECIIELDGIYYCSTQHNPQLKNKGYITIYNCQINKGDSNIITGDFYCIYKNQIIKEANTIKELCNKFILKNTDIIFLNKENTQYRFEGSNEWFDITDTELRMGIYGAIWTDKGLIYVAKMNDKGELELNENN